MRKLYSKILILVAAVLCLGFTAPALASASCASPTSTKEAIQCGTCDSAGVPCSSDPTGSLNTTISEVVNVLSAAVGVVAVIMIIIAGFRYVTSGGKQESVTGAKNTILYAVIGLAIVALAQIIVHFVLNKTANATAANGPSMALSINQSKEVVVGNYKMRLP